MGQQGHEDGVCFGSRTGCRPGWYALVSLTLVCSLTSGCISGGLERWYRNGFKVGPNYCEPPAPVAEKWIDAGNPKVRSELEEHPTWWRVFGDPVLDALIDTACKQNVDLRVAGMRVLEARAVRAIAAGELFPQNQQAVGAFSHFGTSANVANPNGARFYDDWATGFNLSWELDFWGRFRRAIESADANVAASVAGYDDILVTLLADVATNYIEIRILQQRLEYLHQNMEIQRETLRVNESQARAMKSDMDVQQARAILKQTEGLIPPLKAELRQANNRLCILLGVPPRDLLPELEKKAIPTAPHEVAVGIPADLLRRRPDIRRAERQIAAQCAQIGIAEADLYPRFTLNGTIGVESQDFSKLLAHDSMAAQVGPAFTWQILNYGRIVNNVCLQDARTSEMVATYQSTVLRANREVEDALTGFLQAQEQAESVAESVKAAERAAKLGDLQYRAGKIDYNRLFVQQTLLVQQQDQLVVAQGGIALNLVGVYRALGGGWEYRCQRRQRPVRAMPVLPREEIPAPTPMPASNSEE